jgi:hypothetical protein
MSPQKEMLILNFKGPPFSKKWSYFHPLNSFSIDFFNSFSSSKVFHPLNIYQNTSFHGPTLIGANFAFTSEV